MRAKKLLSVLLAAALAFGIFSVIPASAMDGAAGELAAQTASAGYPTGGIEITVDPSLVSRWDCSALVWDVFTSSAPGVSDGYYDLKGQNKAMVEWRVYAYINDMKLHLVVYSNEADAMQTNSIAVFTDSTSTQERLYIKQGKASYCGMITVEMVLRVEGENDLYTGEKTVYLRDQSSFDKLLADAQKILGRSSRYRKDYLQELEKFRNIAQLFLNADSSLPEFFDQLQDVMRSLQYMIDMSQGYYQLTGWQWLDDMLGNGVMKLIWTIIDIFTFGLL